MLLILILCACLKTLHASALAPPRDWISRDTAKLSGIVEPKCPDVPHCRTVYTILRSCLLTIFACVWKSAHPNINGPRDSGWTRMKRRLITMLYAVIAPELVLLWALRQHLAAQGIAQRYNRDFAGAVLDSTKKSLWRCTVGWFVSLWGNAVAWFHPLPKESTWRGDGQFWTKTHGFFIQMGGFILYDNGYPQEVLDYERLAELLRDNKIDAPTVTERDLQDRSKGDTISKAVAVLQTAWFVFQCIVRTVQHLPLGELEVLTLAFALVNGAIYWVWWSKPQGVDTAICVPLKRTEKEITESIPPSVVMVNKQPHHQHPYISARKTKHDIFNPVPRSLPLDQVSPGSTLGIFSFILLLPLLLLYRIVTYVLRPLNKMAKADVINKEDSDMRVPMFYASGKGSMTSFVASSVIGTIFGSMHLASWASEFPSTCDLVLWRVAAIALSVIPALELLLVVVLSSEVIQRCLGYLLLLLMPCYIASRFAVIVIAFRGIRDPPRNVLLDLSWMSYVPHL